MSTTRKLRLGPLPDTQTIKLAFYVFGEPQSGPRSLRRAARANLWRGGRFRDVDPAHAGGVQGRGSRIQEGANS